MNYKWLALLAVSVGSFVVSFNLSMIFTAAPTIMKDFGISISTVSWLGIAYALSFAGLQPVMGNLADIRGKKKLFSMGLVIFTIGSAIAASSWDILSMSLARFVQGVGAAAVFPTGMAILGDVFSKEERGKALGIWGIAGSAGPGIGITFGGIIFDFFNGWRAIYWVSVILGIASLAVALSLIRSQATGIQNVSGASTVTPKNNDKEKKIDYLGSLSFMGNIAFLVIMINQLDAPMYELLLLFAGFLMLSFAFVQIERKRGEYATVDLSLVARRSFIAIGVTAFLSFVALQGSLFLLPFFLENIARLSASTAGILVTPLFIALAIGSFFGGTLSDKTGAKRLAIFGAAISSIGLYLFSYLNADTPYWYVALASTIAGIGIGFVLPPLGRAIIAAAPPEKRGSASGMFNTIRNLGGPLGIAILPKFLEDSIKSRITSDIASGENQRLAMYNGAIQGFSDTFLVATAISFLGVIAALLIPKSRDPKRSNRNIVQETTPSLKEIKTGEDQTVK